MWISKKKWRNLKQRIADLEEKVQSQQIHINISREALINAGINYDLLVDKASRKQF